MFIGLGILVLVFLFLLIVQNFLTRKWKLIYSAHGTKKYFEVIGNLQTEGMKFKVETPNRGFNHRIDRFLDDTQYDIYVKKEVEHLAFKAIQKRN